MKNASVWPSARRTLLDVSQVSCSEEKLDRWPGATSTNCSMHARSTGVTAEIEALYALIRQRGVNAAQVTARDGR